MRLNKYLEPSMAKLAEILGDNEEEAELHLSFLDAYLAHELSRRVAQNDNDESLDAAWNQISEFLFDKTLGEVTKNCIGMSADDIITA